MAIKQLNKFEKSFNPGDLRLAAEGWKKHWQVLIAIMLSAQTRDTTTIKICEELFEKYPSLEKLSGARIASIEKIIRPVNYHRTKAKHVKETAKFLVGKRVPMILEELILLPGVGRKTAGVYLAEVHKVPAIGVDTHVARLSRKMGWTKNTNPDKVEEDLKKLFPERYWNKINFILVSFGQTYGRSPRKEDEKLKEIFIKEFRL